MRFIVQFVNVWLPRLAWLGCNEPTFTRGGYCWWHRAASLKPTGVAVLQEGRGRGACGEAAPPPPLPGRAARRPGRPAQSATSSAAVRTCRARAARRAASWRPRIIPPLHHAPRSPTGVAVRILPGSIRVKLLFLILSGKDVVRAPRSTFDFWNSSKPVQQRRLYLPDSGAHWKLFCTHQVTGVALLGADWR